MIVTARQSYIEMLLSMLRTGQIELDSIAKRDLCELAGMHREWDTAEGSAAETYVVTRATAKLRHEIRHMS